jgi:uncharacterized protein
MNIVAHALPFEAYQVPLAYGVETVADSYTWIISHSFANGTFRALFSILFGVSIILLTQNKEDGPAEKFFLKRCLWLALIGLFHAHIMLFFGDILFAYAVVGMLVLFWRNMSNKKLYWVTGSFIFMKLLVFGGMGFMLTLWMGYDLSAYQEMISEQTNTLHTGSIAQIAGHAGSYFEAMKVNSGMAFEMETIMLPFLFIDIPPLMLVGFILYRTGFITGEKSCGFYAITLLIGLVVGLGLNGALTYDYIESEFSMSSQMYYMSMNDITRTALAVSIISAVHVTLKMGILKFLTNGLANIGKMALTNYMMQSLIALILFNRFGFDLFMKFGRAELLYFVAGIWTFSFIFSHFWLKYYQYGPVEWLWRSLSYGRRLALKKDE